MDVGQRMMAGSCAREVHEINGVSACKLLVCPVKGTHKHKRGRCARQHPENVLHAMWTEETVCGAQDLGFALTPAAPEVARSLQAPRPSVFACWPTIGSAYP